MDLKINSAQPNFRARMQLRGNISLLKKKQAQSLKTIIDKIGAKTDIVDITLPEKLAKSGVVQMAGYINGELEQFVGKYKNSDIYSGIINGLDKVKEIFPTVALTTGGAVAVNENLNADNDTKVSKIGDLTTITTQPTKSAPVYRDLVVDFLKRKIKLVREDLEEYYIGSKNCYNIDNIDIVKELREIVKNDTNFNDESGNNFVYILGEIIKSNPEKKETIINKICTKVLTSYVQEPNIILDMIKQAEDDKFRAKCLDEFSSFMKMHKIFYGKSAYDIFGDERIKDYFKYEQFIWDLFDSITNCSNSNLCYILADKIDDFKGRYSYEEPDFVDVEKGLGEMLQEPKYLKRIIKLWLDNKLANRTTVEERLTTKINELGSTFNEKYEKLNSSIDEIKKEMFSEDDIKKIIVSETYTLRKTVEEHDKKLFPPKKELGPKDIEQIEKDIKGDFLQDFHDAIIRDTMSTVYFQQRFPNGLDS